jgi:hypothetical protein
MSGNGGLFDSDDEDDIQYNPDEGNQEDEVLDEPVQQQPEPQNNAVPNIPVSKAEPTQESQEEEKIETSPVAPSSDVPKPVAVKQSLPAQSQSEIDEIYTVSDPVNTGHVTYTIKGRDEDGEFEGSRRYNDFYHLRTALVNRWPGTYVPPIPSKKAVGNKDDKYIEHRRYFLQRFLRRIAICPHLLNSDEFKLFARPSGEIEKMLSMMPKQTPEIVVDRFKVHLHVDEFPDDFLVKQCKEIINDFGSFCKKILPTLKVVREQTGKMVAPRNQQNENYKSLMESM